MRCASCLMWTVLLGAAVPASAQVTFEPRIPANQQWSMRATVKTDQTLKLAGMDIVTGAEQVITMQLSSGTAEDGRIPVRHKITGLEAHLKLPGGVELNFDSNNPDAPGTGTQFDAALGIFRALAKAEWTQVYGPDGRAVAVQGNKELLESLDAELRPLLERQLSEEYLIEQANNELDKLPPRPVQAGDTWTDTIDVRLDGGQHLIFDVRFQYEGPVERDGRQVDRVTTTATGIKYEIDEDAPTPLRVTASELKIEESEGMYLFDRQLGQIVENRGKTHIVGSIAFEVNEMELPAELDLVLDMHSVRE